ncbi:MAG: hypothetical protein AAFQ17_00340, partial [Pseudomonadota bacterium]
GMLVDHVTVERRFQRSIRLDSDLGSSDALQGYVLHTSTSTALTTTARLLSEGQGAFTWTGPYGGGSMEHIALQRIRRAEIRV